MKWPQIIVVVIGIIGVAIAVRLRPEKPVAPPPASAIPPPAIVTGLILPPAIERPGVASRLFGLLRTYVALAEEIHLEPSADEPAARITRIPILIALENETYRPLTAAAAGWIGQSLCTVRVVRLRDDGGEVEVFHTDVPMPPRSDWLSAERRNVMVDWPLLDGTSPVTPGQYKITVRLGLPEEPAVEIYTRLL